MNGPPQGGTSSTCAGYGVGVAVRRVLGGLTLAVAIAACGDDGAAVTAAATAETTTTNAVAATTEPVATTLPITTTSAVTSTVTTVPPATTTPPTTAKPPPPTTQSPTTTQSTPTTAAPTTGTVNVVWEPDSDQSGLGLTFTDEATGQTFSTVFSAGTPATTRTFPHLAARRWRVDTSGSTQVTDSDGRTIFGDSLGRYTLDVPAGAATEISCSYGGCDGPDLAPV